MAAKKAYVANQFEPPALPTSWNRDAEARRFYTRLMEVLERLYNRSVNTVAIKDHSITAEKFAPGAIDRYVLGPDAVQTVNIQDAAVTLSKIADGAVRHTKLAEDAVHANNIRNGEVTLDKLAPSVIPGMDLTRNDAFDTVNEAVNAQTTGLLDRMDAIESENLASRVGAVEETLNAEDTGVLDVMESIQHRLDVLEAVLFTGGTGIRDAVVNHENRITALEGGNP